MNNSYTIRQKARNLIKKPNFGVSLKLSAFIVIWYLLDIGVSYYRQPNRIISEHAIAETIRYAAGSVTSGLFSSVVIGIFALGTMWGFVEWYRDKQVPEEPYAKSVRFWHGDTIRDVVVILGVRFIFIFLWSLLLFVPGIIKTYSYAQADLLFAEDVKNNRPIANATEYLTESRELMLGHKMELFVLDLTFIGWWILMALTFGLAAIYVVPYHTAARAEFFVELRGGVDEPAVKVEVLQPKQPSVDDEL